MGRLLVLISLLAAPAAGLAQPASRMSPTPAASQLLQRDWVLANWALKFYDRDRDILLDPAEAQAAADEFRRIADGNNDGRLTPHEYRAAREFILARY